MQISSLNMAAALNGGTNHTSTAITSSSGDTSHSAASDASAAATAVYMPNQYGSATNGVSGGTGEPASLYAYGGFTKTQGS